MAAPMSDADYEIAKKLIECGALIHIESCSLPKGGCALTPCSDGRDLIDTVTHHKDLVCSANGNSHHTDHSFEPLCYGHMVSFPGGPAALSKNAPFCNLVFQEEIKASAFDIACSGIETALKLHGLGLQWWCGVPHSSCGQCTRDHINLTQNLRFSLEGKELLKEVFIEDLENFILLPRLNFTGRSEAALGVRQSFFLARSVFEKFWDKHTSPSGNEG